MPVQSDPPERLPLRRPEAGRWFGGVCAGLSAHLDVPVRLVRIGMAVGVLVGGAGLVMYLWLWLLVPSGDPATAARDERPASLSRIAPRLGEVARKAPVTDIALGAVLLTAGGVLVADRVGAGLNLSWLLPLLMLLAGAVLAWSQLDSLHRDRFRLGGRTPVNVLRLTSGIALVGVGVVFLVTRGSPGSAVLRTAVASLAVLVGAAAVLAPWVVRLVRELGDERAARAREAERADIAAHLHDSVLQTLALIRSQAQDGEAVARLARAQERELRGWLYEDRHEPGTSLADDLRCVVAEVEDLRSVTIDVVVVGDAQPSAATEALLAAAREALLNAAAHADGPYSVYLEVAEDKAEVFVRDRGPGFDPEQIPPDRFGVRESILGRVRRRGGTATVRSSPGRSTEVVLTMPLRREAQEQEAKEQEAKEREAKEREAKEPAGQAGREPAAQEPVVQETGMQEVGASETRAPSRRETEEGGR